MSNRKLASRATEKGIGLTFDLFTEVIQELWLKSAQQAHQGVPYWLPLPTGWDDRPRSFARSTIIRDRTPEKFAAVCREARAFCEKNGIKHAVIHPINEWQEGSYIEPNEEYGFAMYDALRDAFCEKPETGWPKNIKPSDVGLGPYDYPPLFRSAVQHWDFADSVEGWYRQPYGGGELEVKEGALNFWINWQNNFNIRQRVMPFDAAKYSKFRICMKITPNAKAGLWGVENPSMLLKWGTEESPIIGQGLVVDRDRSVAGSPVKVDGEFHEYTLDLSANPDWKGMVDGEVHTRDFAMLNIYDNPRKCAGFAQTELKISVDDKGRCVVANVGKIAAVGVMLDLGKDEGKAILGDNFFFLPAGEGRLVSIALANAVHGVSALNAPPVFVGSSQSAK